MNRRKPNQKNPNQVPPGGPQLFYFDCGHATFNSGKDPAAVLQMPPKLSIEGINSHLLPELRGKVGIACYPGELCGVCHPKAEQGQAALLAMIKAQLKAQRLPIPPDDELLAEIKRRQRQAQK